MPNLTGFFVPVLGFLGLPKWLTDPWGYIRDKLEDLYNGLGGLFDKWVIHPPGPLPGSWQNDIYGNALGLAGGLAAATFIVLLVVAMFAQRKLVSLGKSAVVAVAIGSLGPLFYSASDWFVQAGTDLTREVANLGSLNSQQLLLLPDMNNVFGAIAGIVSVSALGGILVVIFLVYQLLIILLTFFGLPLLALYPLGRVPQTVMRWVVSIGLMAAVVGRPLAALELKLTSLAINHIQQQDPSSFVAVTVLAAMFLIAIASQVGLIYLAHKAYSGIEGVVSGTSLVRGRVETMTKDTVKVELDRVSDRFAAKGAAVAALAGPEATTAYLVSRRMRRPNNSSSISTSFRPRENESGSSTGGE